MTVAWIVPPTALWVEMEIFIFLTALIFSYMAKMVPILCWIKNSLVWLNISHFALDGNFHTSTDVFQQFWVFVINVAKGIWV